MIPLGGAPGHGKTREVGCNTHPYDPVPGCEQVSTTRARDLFVGEGFTPSRTLTPPDTAAASSQGVATDQAPVFPVSKSSAKTLGPTRRRSSTWASLRSL